MLLMVPTAKCFTASVSNAIVPRLTKSGLSPETEPTIGCAVELARLDKAELDAIASSGRGNPRAGGIAATCREISNLAKQLSSPQQLAIDMELQGILQKVKSAVPKFEKTAIAKQKSETRKWNRQPTDKRHKALLPNRTETKVKGKSRAARAIVEAAAVAYMEEKQSQVEEDDGPILVPARAHGRTKNTYRGLQGSLLRSTKSGNRRTPRRRKG